MKFLKGFVRRFATAFSIASILAVTAVGGLVYAATQFPTGVAGDTSVGSVVLMWWNGTAAVPANATNPLPVTASVTASISGFAPASVGTPISVTTGGVTGNLPAGTVVVASNVGATNIAYCALGGSATTAWQPIAPNGGWFAFTVGAATQLTCITSTSTTTINMVGGSGLPTGTGGGGGGSGGGGAVTLASGAVASGAYSSGSIASGAAVSGAFADGAITTIGAKTDAKNAATDTTAVSEISVLKEISSLEQAPASRAVTNAGTFATQDTQAGTWTVQPGNTANTTAWLVTGTGGTFPATESGTWNITNISGTVSLPTGAATSANQTNASQKTQIVDGSGNVIASTSNNLDVQCANCSGSGVSTADGASFTAGSSLFAGIGGVYQSSATSNPLTAGDQGFIQLTHYRAGMFDWYNSSGVEMGTSGSPVQVSLANTGANGTALLVTGTGGAFPATQSGTWTMQPGNTPNTSPWLTTISQGGNAAPVVTASTATSSDKALEVAVANANANGQATMANSSPVVIASNQSALSTNPGTAANWGVGATGSATPANAISNGLDAQSSEPAAATTGNLTAAMGDLAGKTVTSPYANRENMLRGAASSASNTAVSLIAAQGAGIKTYVTDVECGRTDAGTTAIYVTFSDAASTILVLPNSGGGGGNNKTFNVPLVTAANTAFTFTPSASTSTVYCEAQAFKGY